MDRELPRAREQPRWLWRVTFLGAHQAELGDDRFYRRLVALGGWAFATFAVAIVVVIVGFVAAFIAGVLAPAGGIGALAGALAFWVGVIALVIWLASVVTLRVAYFARARAIKEVADSAATAPNVYSTDLEYTLAVVEAQEHEWVEQNRSQTVVLSRYAWSGLAALDTGEWQFRPRVNVLLGKNGYGKTLLLRIMAMLIQRDRNAARKVFGDVLSNTGQSRAVVDVVRNGTTESVVLENGIFKDTVGRLPLLAIPDSRFINRANQTLAATAAGTEPLYRSGASNFLNQEPYDGVIQDLLAQLAADYFTTNQRLDLPLVQLVERVVQQLTEDRTFKFAAIERSGRVGYRILVRTEIHPSTPLPIQAASQGTLSVVSIFGLIYSFLDSNWPNTPESEITSRPGVVIIDELDAHLHPSWQRKIMGLLTRTFPNVQFIVSAHSPLVVGGCDWGEVAVLRRPEPGRGFRLERIEHDFIGAQSADVYRQIFEVDDASDRLYLQYTATLDPGADVEREIQRLERKRFLSDEDKQQLNDLRANLQDTKRLAKRAAEAREERLNTESTDARIRQLEGEVRRLQSQLKLRAAELAARHPEDAVNELSTSDSTVEDRSR